MKLEWKKQQEIKSVLNGLIVSTNLEIYKEILTEIERLWDIENKAILVLVDKIPTHGFTSYPSTSLEDRVKDRLNKTKELIDLLGNTK